ncbi:MAG: hypothetical protein ACYC61_14945 [Isosphaeraceae bacterium]
MRRFRETLITAAAVVALAAMAGDTLAQQQGGGGGGGGRGGRGGFGGGPGGFFGGRGGFGPGGNLLGLALNPAVQGELKVTDPQKTNLQDLNEKLNQSRRKVMEQFRPQGQQGGPGNRNNGQNGGVGQGAGNGQGGFGGQNGGGGFGGGRGGRGQQDPEAMARRQAMFESMNGLQQEADQALARILSRGQMGRLKQIQLQAEGPRALTRPDMIEKLNLDEEQVAQINQLLGEERQAMGETFRARFDLMGQAFPQDNTNTNGGQGGNGNAGGNGGGRRPRGPNFRDPAVREAMQKYMDQPEVKAKMDQIQAQTNKLQSQLRSAVNRVLTRRQASNYQRMLGAPFDLDSLRGGPGGNRNPNANGNTPSSGTQPAAKTANNNSDDEDEATPTARPAVKAPTQTPAKARRKSLREQRGLDD